MAQVKTVASALVVVLTAAIVTGQTASGSRAHAVTDEGADHPSTAISKEQADAIVSELRQIRVLLERQQQLLQGIARPAAPIPVAEAVRVPAESGYSLGRTDAALSLVEFADYQCPYCRHFHSAVFEQLKRNYIDTGKLRFVSRDFPLDMHASAFKAARCAGDQNNFWQMRDLLITHSDILNDDNTLAYARQLGLEMSGFQSCLATGKYLPEIRHDIADAASAGITGTPSFVLGRVADGMIDGIKLVGAPSYSQLEKIVNDYSSRRVAFAGQRP
jgi:protein-disulfide isomerase